MDDGWSRARFATARVARLATADRDGRPHVVPIVFVAIGDGLFTVVDRKPKADSQRPGARLRRLDNIRANPTVSVLVDHYADDWERLWWARADGSARLVDTTATEAAEAMRALIRRYPQYQAEPPPGPMIAIAVQRWSGWAASEAAARS
jgi:PPOX class probable F420-dependent enzyme